MSALVETSQNEVLLKSPAVSFIVPCYKLAHLLPECINSILSQSYEDFEILIMDDCSPDHTEQIASSFTDSRIRYIRNDPNLGHLRNYNKGIALARGRYVWLISADDCLRRRYVLERYVECLDQNPSVGYACCSGVDIKDGQEGDLLHYSLYADQDRLVPGHEFLKRLLEGNIVLAASGFVRRECYERLGAFPLDMPYGGDWYLWCLFALYYDVAYFADPMVCYRQHDLSLTNLLMAKSAQECLEEDLAIPWVIKEKADAVGFRSVSREVLRALGYIYGRSMAFPRYHGLQVIRWEEFELSLSRHVLTEEEQVFARSQACIAMADEYFARGDVASAGKWYDISLSYDRWNMKLQIKRRLLTLGSVGTKLRKVLRRARDGKTFGTRIVI